MPYYEKRGERWRVQVRRKGVDQSRTFRTKAAAREWALQVEAGITGESRTFGRHTVIEALRRYSLEESPKKRGKRWEQIRLNALEAGDFGKRPIAQVSEDHIAKWRNERLQEVGPATVRREMNLLSSVFEMARSEWKWIRVNPFRGVKKPQEPAARRRGVTDAEIKAVCEKLSGPVGKHIAQAFRFAVETGMRQGEILSLGWPQIDLQARVARLEKTKNGDKRDVALSPVAVALLQSQEGLDKPFPITSQSADTLFRKARNSAGLPDLHFHDSRSEAVMRLSKRLNVLELAEQIGHRDLNSLQFYYKQPATERAMRLDAGPQTKK